MTHLRLIVITLMVLGLVPVDASAQEGPRGWGGRAFVTVDVGAQTASPDFVYEHSTSLYDQLATAGLKIPGQNGVAVDFGVGVRLVQNLGAGITYSRYQQQRTGTLQASIPSMFASDNYLRYFCYYYVCPESLLQASSIERQIPFEREEEAIHLQAIYRIPIGHAVRVGVFGGPTRFRCLDDVVAQFALHEEALMSQQFPDVWSVRFRDVTKTVHKGVSWGAHGGVNVTVALTQYLGVGATFRYSQASHTTENYFADTDGLDDSFVPNLVWGGGEEIQSITMKHGGMQWNGGITFEF